MLNLSRLFVLFSLVSLMYPQIQYGGIPRTFEIESLEDICIKTWKDVQAGWT